MRVFIYEYASAQPDAQALPISVRREGRAMLEAITADFKEIPGLDVVLLPSTRSQCEEVAFRQVADSCDWALVIAPEFDALLETRCRWVETSNARLLGPSAEFVREFADKWNLYRLCSDWGLPVPRTWLGGAQPSLEHCVLKPRWGAGSLGVRRIRAGTLASLSDSWIGQEYCPGMPASISLIAGTSAAQPASISTPCLPVLANLQRRTRQVALLPPARQLLGGGSSFEYQGGQLPLPAHLFRRTRKLVEPLVEKLVEHPGLRGYCGIDVVLGEPADGRADRIIELNCRLTTSYLGLRALSSGNLATLLLAAAEGKPLSLPAWRNGVANFDAAGQTTFVPAQSPDCRITDHDIVQDLPLEA